MKLMNMNSIRFLAPLIFAAGIWVTPARAQDMPKQGAAPKPAPSASEAVLEQWNDIGRKLIAMAEDFPMTSTISSLLPWWGLLLSD